MRRIEIYDSTLRDGAQGQGVSFSVSDKIRIVDALDGFGIDYIEAGFPASNPKDEEFFRKIRSEKLSHAKLCAFGRTLKYGETPENDPALASLVASGAVGNLIDRIALGYVRDFIDLEFINFYIFNFADCAICVGAGLLILYAFLNIKD